MRIAQVAPLFESVPPKYYGGTERVVSYLTEELVRQGHDVTLFASGDSETAAELVAVTPRSLRLDARAQDQPSRCDRFISQPASAFRGPPARDSFQMPMIRYVILLLAAVACAPHRHAAEPAAPPVAARPDTNRAPYTRADVDFLAGMISHHAQAIQMAGWAPTHGASAAVRALSERIVVAQQDEIAFAERWLRERNEHVPPADPRGHIIPGMDHPMLMPGMLTPEQMALLDAARGREFDRLFLTFMIQHHLGAIRMVEQLLAVPGAAQDGPVFRFASDVNADQTSEITRMTLMLDELKRSSQ